MDRVVGETKPRFGIAGLECKPHGSVKGWFADVQEGTIHGDRLHSVGLRMQGCRAEFVDSLMTWNRHSSARPEA